MADIHIYFNGMLKHDIAAIKKIDKYIAKTPPSKQEYKHINFLLESFKSQLLYKIKSIADVLKVGYDIDIPIEDKEIELQVYAMKDSVILDKNENLRFLTPQGALENIDDILERVETYEKNKNVGKKEEE